MANGKSQPSELTIEGVTLIFGEEMPPRSTGKGTTKYDAIVETIREKAVPGMPIRLAGVKVSGVAGLKKRYSDIHFETRGGKDNPTVWATLREELVDA